MEPDFEPVFAVSEFVDIFNQTLEAAYPSVVIVGEIANFRVSKNRWVYFDLKDDDATVKFFGNVYQLNGPLEDGMLLKVRGVPKLHKNFGFSININTISLVGEGSIKRSSEILMAKLTAEGLFDESRKRILPYPPTIIGLITSGESAAYADFVKIVSHRWPALRIIHADVLVQGEASPGEIVSAINFFNQMNEPPEVLVLIRGGGSAEDLASFSTEAVTRAVALSRVPTLVAIGHEVDVSLAELAADLRASTPSNAAELLVPHQAEVRANLISSHNQLLFLVETLFSAKTKTLAEARQSLGGSLESVLHIHTDKLDHQRNLLSALNPEAILRRGYAVVYHQAKAIYDPKTIPIGADLDIRFAKGWATAVLGKRRYIKGGKP